MTLICTKVPHNPGRYVYSRHLKPLIAYQVYISRSSHCIVRMPAAMLGSYPPPPFPKINEGDGGDLTIKIGIFLN